MEVKINSGKSFSKTVVPRKMTASVVCSNASNDLPYAYNYLIEKKYVKRRLEYVDGFLFAMTTLYQ